MPKSSRIWDRALFPACRQYAFISSSSGVQPCDVHPNHGDSARRRHPRHDLLRPALRAHCGPAGDRGVPVVAIANCARRPLRPLPGPARPTPPGCEEGPASERGLCPPPRRRPPEKKNRRPRRPSPRRGRRQVIERFGPTAARAAGCPREKRFARYLF